MSNSDAAGRFENPIVDGCRRDCQEVADREHPPQQRLRFASPPDAIETTASWGRYPSRRRS
jgi:hypothetical protein